MRFSWINWLNQLIYKNLNWVSFFLKKTYICLEEEKRVGPRKPIRGAENLHMFEPLPSLKKINMESIRGGENQDESLLTQIPDQPQWRSAYKKLGEKTILDKSTPNKIIRGCVLYTRLSHTLHLSGPLNKWFLLQPPRQENLMCVLGLHGPCLCRLDRTKTYEVQ